MGINFPNAPTLNQLYPQPSVPGLPVYRWDGEKWTTGQTDSTQGAVRYDTTQNLTYLQQAQARANTGALKKNYIINGAMMVSQENGTTAGSINGYYLADQFRNEFGVTTGAADFSQSLATYTPAGSTGRLRVVVKTASPSVAASDLITIMTNLEGIRVADLFFGSSAPKTVTLQFGVRAPAGTYCVSLHNGAQNRYYVAEYVIAAGEANTDVVKSVTLAGDASGVWNADSSAGIRIRWSLMCGTTNRAPTANVWTAGLLVATANQFNIMGTVGNVFELFDVGLYEGAVAPPFVVPDYASELALCQRYWRKTLVGTGAAWSTTDVALVVPHAGMRVAPQYTVSGIITITDVFATNPAQTSAGISTSTNTADFGQYNFPNYTGLVVGRLYQFNVASAGVLKLNARL